MYVDNIYTDDALRGIFANGVAVNATAEWPWLVISSPGWPAARRRGFRTMWGTILLYSFDEKEVSEVGIEGHISENPFFDLGEIWGKGVTVRAYLSDLVSMHFARVTRRTLSRAGWDLEDVDTEDGTIFRISAAMPPAQGEQLGKAMGLALLQANVADVSLACRARAYLEGLKDAQEVPTRPVPGQAGLN